MLKVKLATITYMYLKKIVGIPIKEELFRGKVWPLLDIGILDWLLNSRSRNFLDPKTHFLFIFSAPDTGKMYLDM